MDDRLRTDRNHHATLGSVGIDSDEIRQLKLIEEGDLSLVPVAVHVYDTTLLEWIRGQQAIINATGDLTVTMGDVESLLAKYYWKNTQVEYNSSNNPIYIGRNTDLSAADGDTDWYITRIDWIGNNWTRKRVRITSWTLRASGW